MSRLFHLLLLLSLTLSPTLKSAHAITPVECACPGADTVLPKSTDKNYNATCRKFEPQKVQKDCFGKDGLAVCETCHAVAPVGPIVDSTGKVVAIVGASGAQVPPISTSPSKTFSETLDYVSCYRTPTRFKIKSGDQQYCHFKKTLAPYIKLAADSAKLNPSVFSCLIKRESELDPRAKSNFYAWETKINPATGEKVRTKVLKHAYSYAQFTLETLDYIGRIVKGSPGGQLDRANDAREKVRELEEKLAQIEALPVKKRIGYSKTKAELKGAKYHLREVLSVAKARAVWDKYWDGTKYPPKTVNLDSLYCPKIAFALSAVKQTFDLYTLFDESELVETGNTIRSKSLKVSSKLSEADQIAQQEYDTSLYVTGSYNQGPGGFDDDCVAEKGIQSCMNQRNWKKPLLPEETIDHLHSINDCAKAGSDKAMNGTETKDNCKDLKCSS